MPPVIVYSSAFCPFCHRAKRLLNEKGVSYQEIDVVMDPCRRQEMTQKAGGRRTVPQIFVGQTHVGGCDDLMDAERSGRLDQLLAAT